MGNRDLDKSLEGVWEKFASMTLYGEGNELGRVEMIKISLNAGNDEVPGGRALIHVAKT
jgi:hypothetical protein